ncbi:unnamed protein product [Peniophora sp. CBMAI 1063]|nr:unnamed protein product [Peniophora sp. CBMAI 1063]
MTSLDDRPPPIVHGAAYISQPPPPESSFAQDPVRPALTHSHARRSHRKHKRRAASEEPPSTPAWTESSGPSPYVAAGRAGGTPFAFQSPHLAPDDSISAAPAPQPMYASFAMPQAGPYPPPPPPPVEQHDRTRGMGGPWPSVQDNAGVGAMGMGMGGWTSVQQPQQQQEGWTSGQWDEQAMMWSPGSASYSSGHSGFVPSPGPGQGAQPALLATPVPYPGTPSPNPNPNPYGHNTHEHRHGHGHHHQQHHSMSSYPTPPPSNDHGLGHGLQQSYFPTSYPPAAQLGPPALAPPPPYQGSSRSGKTQKKLDTIIRSPGDFKDVAHRRFFDRPGSWRPDFRMPRSGLEAVFKKKGKTFSIAIQERHPSELSPKLRYTPFSTAPVHYDMRHPPLPTPHQTHFSFSSLHNRPPTPYDLAGFATEPPLPLMRLYHPRLPWYVDVVAQDPVGVTLREVFEGIWEVMSRQVRESDYWNSEVEDEERAKIDRAYAIRCTIDPTARQGGVRKVDFLMRECIFLGLSKGREGMYEMRTRKI